MIKKYFNDWNLYEKILLVSSIFFISLFGIIFSSDILTIACSIIGILGALLIAKGKISGQFFGILIVILYSIVSFKNKFYGETIIYVFIKLPMFIIGIFSWIKHQNKETNSVEVKKISNKELLYILILSIFIFIGLYYLLKSFDTKELFISTLSAYTSLFAVYLLIRRSKYSFYFYIINDLVLILLWGVPLINGNINLFAMFLNPVINLINDSYGVYNWRKLELKQNDKAI